MSSRRRVRLFVSAALLLYGLLLFGYKHLDHVARHVPVPAIVPFVEEMTGVVAALPGLVVVVAVVRRFPLDRTRWWRNLPVHLVNAVLCSVVHTWLMAKSRAILFPLLGLGPYDYGDMSVRYWMEMANDMASYAIEVMLVMGYDSLRLARAREIDQAELRAELARAEIQNLERRLHPHFLFNALNTISSVMYDDPAAADRMISGLSDLLRRALRTGDAQEVPLVEELALLDGYLSIMRARFEERLDVALEIDDDAKGALVPPLLLQPLVENAIRHGADPASHRVRAALRARREGSALRLEVRDHGRGLSGAEPAQGVGLSTTARRLAALYGDGHRLAFEDADGGGLRVTIELPFRTAGAGG
ncbi:MAG TPA: histidine kinase [Polyangiaceae bacterium]